jgi:hypothetical protein
VASKRTPKDFGFCQLTAARTHTRGSVNNEKETSTLAPLVNSSALFSDIPPELISRLVVLKRRPSALTIDTSVISGTRT